MKAAGRSDEGRQTGLIKPDQGKRGGFPDKAGLAVAAFLRPVPAWGGLWRESSGGDSRGNKRSNSRTSESNETLATTGRGFKTISHPPGTFGRFSRKTSRSRRLMRLRTTELPIRVVTVIPRRVSPNPFGRKKIVHSDALRRCPSS
jgi:hypothetical protein